MTKRKKPNVDECVTPALNIPADELARYSPVRDFHSEQDIARYVEGQARDENVQHVEKVKEESIFDEKYEIWDVITDRGRWWVITNLTNLYSQAHFPSLDYVFSFHIGLMARLRARSVKDDREPSPFEEVARRQDQAHERHYSAIESEEFQTVGLQLRECLLSLITAMRRQIDFLPTVGAPRDADFLGWYDVLMDRICAGESKKQLRQYMKTVGRETWQLVNWLTHHRNASQATSGIALHACDTLLGHSIHLTVLSQTAEICPKCRSRDIRSHYDPTIEPGGSYFSTCGACGWSSHPADADSSTTPSENLH